jgi:hypothetical protein
MSLNLKCDICEREYPIWKITTDDYTRIKFCVDCKKKMNEFKLSEKKKENKERILEIRRKLGFIVDGGKE